MIDKIDGKTLRIFRVIWNVPWCFWGGVRSLKLACFEWYSGVDDEGKGTNKPIQAMIKTKKRAIYFGAVYLVFITLFIFLTAIRLGDNEVIRNVLLTTIVSEAVNVVLMQPLQLFVFAGFLPAVGASLLLYDMKRFFRDETRMALRVRRRNATRLDVVNQGASFELSPQWRKIESEVILDVAAERQKISHQQSVRSAESAALPPTRAVPATSSWSVSADLKRNGVESLRQLCDRKVVTKEFLARDIHLSDAQVTAFWHIIHPEDIVVVPAVVEVTTLQKVAHFFLGSKLGSGQQMRQRKPANPSAVFPVLSGSS